MIRLINLLYINISFTINSLISLLISEIFYHYHNILLPSTRDNQIKVEMVLMIGSIPHEYVNSHCMGNNHEILYLQVLILRHQMRYIYFDLFHTNYSRYGLETNPESVSIFHHYLRIHQPRVQLSHGTVRFNPGDLLEIILSLLSREFGGLLVFGLSPHAVRGENKFL
jgi:hypothetical protein